MKASLATLPSRQTIRTNHPDSQSAGKHTLGKTTQTVAGYGAGLILSRGTALVTQVRTLVPAQPQAGENTSSASVTACSVTISIPSTAFFLEISEQQLDF
ncbi:hypothetical protein ACFQ5D_03940 [Paenibacillus farraposensis]|uniref:Uncharacterized protein n=1 Tax=Paenibacillus farraposensis TaxID=2807095 RepID=A0ABW4D7C3_9BACL|nr:hypothetical protein [Paenibacillus farraposensis]